MQRILTFYQQKNNIVFAYVAIKQSRHNSNIIHFLPGAEVIKLFMLNSAEHNI